MTPSSPPPWFSTEIRSGLASLYALSLEGCPGADTLQATAALWTGDLWGNRKRYWHQDLDTGCIRQAFATLRQTCRRWPTESAFWDALPNRPAPKNLQIGPGWGREREADALACRDRWLADLGYDRTGAPIA